MEVGLKTQKSDSNVHGPEVTDSVDAERGKGVNIDAGMGEGELLDEARMERTEMAMMDENSWMEQ